jgi:PKD repeat protein
MEKNYRYPGTRPFQEKDSHLFFGRTSDKVKLTELIELEKLVVLFGKSGYGKSSLLNAAVIPRLRRFGQQKVYNVRFKEAKLPDQTKRSPLEILLEQLRNDSDGNNYLEQKLNINADLPEDITALLWYYAKNIQLSNKRKKGITLIFDQFEELSDFTEEQIETFGRTIGELLNLNAPKSVRRLIEQKLDANDAYFSKDEVHDVLKPLNLKVVLSLHHDRLNILDQLKRFLPTIFKYTYELKPLSEKQARQAFLKPAELEGDEFASPKFTYSKEAIDLIFSSLKDSKNKLIEPFQLQLIGQHAEEKVINKKKDKSKVELGIKDLGKPETIYKKHYQKVISRIPWWKWLKRRRVRNLIEKVLIMKGNRVPMPEIVITSQQKVSKKSLEDLLDQRLLRSELNSVKETSYEISHDSLVKPILDSAKRRKRKWLVIILLLIIALLLGWLVYLIAQGSKGTEREVSNGLVINAIATARAMPTKGEVPLKVIFTFNETHNIDSVSVKEYKWDFGDKTDTIVGGSAPLVHTYENEGTYLARLIVEDNYGQIRIDNVEIIVLPDIGIPDPDPPDPSIIGIKANPDSGDAPLEVNFSPIISDSISIAEILWEFNDGDTSEERNPLHTFVKKDSFNVKLTIWDIDGNDYRGNLIVKVGKDPPPDPNNKAPIANISVTRFAENPLKVAFDGSGSTDDVAISEYLWEFNDGKTSPETSPIHTFDSIREYDVRLTVWDDARKKGFANVTIKITDSVQVITESPVISPSDTLGIVTLITESPVISPADTLGIAPFKLKFEVNNTFDTYLWKFPDSMRSTLASPTYEFGIAGTYDVHLSVTDINGRPASTKTTITVKPPPPNAIASASPTQGKVPLPVNFKGSDTGVNGSESTYEWDFKNGSISTDQNPVHVFNTADTLEVQLTVTNKYGLIDRDTIQIRVLPDLSPIAKIKTKLITSDTIPLKVEFSGSSSTDDGAIVSYDWDFGDKSVINDTTIGPVVTHIFPDAGIFNVKLTVVDDRGQSGWATDSIRVNPIKPEHDPIEGETWMKRFIRIQNEHMPSKLSNPNALKNWQIIPDSLNIMGISIPDSFSVLDTTLNTPAGLLFFFTTKDMEKGKVKVYKFRNEINPSESDTKLRSKRFSLKKLIRDAQNQSDSVPDNIFLKFIAPDNTPVRIEESDFKDFAQFIEKNKINDKSLNIYYTLFPYEYFKERSKLEIKKIYEELTPSKK